MQRSLRILMVATGLLGLLSSADPKPDLAADLAALQIPPPWLADVKTTYDTTQPWKAARLHIRKLLDEHRNREAIWLTYDYIVVRKAAPGDHEYPLYLFLGGEYAWALRIYEDRMKEDPEREGIAFMNLAAIYRHYGRYSDAERVLKQGLEHPPKPPWDVPNAAKIHDRLGDLYAETGQQDAAAREYAEAMRLYPTSKQPWGKQNLPKQVRKIRTKLDLVQRGDGAFGPLRDGTYHGSSIGYAKDLRVTLTVRNGKATDLTVEHEEHIEQHATETIPKAILDRQSLQVDAVTSATITSQAIVDATYQAAKRAGMKLTLP
jgi:uncharacterized protein with FMN-binding domain